MKIKLLVGVFLLGLGLMPSVNARSQEAPQVGYLIRCTDEIQVKRRGEVLDVRDLFRLRGADELRVPAKASVDLVHTLVGKQYHLLAGQVARVDGKGLWLLATPPKPVRGQKSPKPQKPQEAQVVRNLPTTVVSANTSRLLGLVTRAIVVAPPLSQPLPFGAVESAEGVTLTWNNTLTREQLGTQKLVLSLRRDGEREPFLEEPLPGESTSFTLPAGTLVEGQLYRWEVSLPQTRTGPQSTGAPLWLLTEPERRAAQEARKLAALIPLTDSTARCLLAEQLRALGLLPEAAAVLKEAQLSDPANAAIAPALAEIRKLLSH